MRQRKKNGEKIIGESEQGIEQKIYSRKRTEN